MWLLAAFQNNDQIIQTAPLNAGEMSDALVGTRVWKGVTAIVFDEGGEKEANQRAEFRLNFVGRLGWDELSGVQPPPPMISESERLRLAYKSIKQKEVRGHEGLGVTQQANLRVGQDFVVGEGGRARQASAIHENGSDEHGSSQTRSELTRCPPYI